MSRFYYHDGIEDFPHDVGPSIAGWYVYKTEAREGVPEGPYDIKPQLEMYDHVMFRADASLPSGTPRRRGVVEEVAETMNGITYFVNSSERGAEGIVAKRDELLHVPQAYTIHISEPQRVALKSLLSWAFSTRIDMAAKPKFVDHPLEFWENMLEDLPKDEAESPGVMHGFCL